MDLLALASFDSLRLVSLANDVWEALEITLMLQVSASTVELKVLLRGWSMTGACVHAKVHAAYPDVEEAAL